MNINEINRKFRGKKIQQLTLSADKTEVIICFDDGSRLFLSDPPSCCEQRYFHSDDKLSSIVGGEFYRMELVDLGQRKHNADIAFLWIYSSSGCVNICAYNEHTGNYGGFEIEGLTGDKT